MTMLEKSLEILSESAPVLYLFMFFGVLAILTATISFSAILKSKEMMATKFYALYAEMAIVDFMLGSAFIGRNLIWFITVQN